MNRIAIDIETAPDPALLAEIPEPEVALGNLKDPAKIAEKIAAAKAAQVERAALDPYFARVLVVSTAWRVDNDNSISALSFIAWPDKERWAFTEFWEHLHSFERFATFNGAGFDLPFLRVRSALHGLRTPRIDTGRYSTIDPAAEHLDVYRFLAEQAPGYGPGSPLGYKQNLDFFARRLLGEEPAWGETNKSNLAVLFEQGRGGEVVASCEQDAILTLKLAEFIDTYYA